MSYSNITFHASTSSYAVFVYSMKPNKWACDRLILVRPTGQCIKAQSEYGFARKQALVSDKWARKMKNYQASEGVRFFKSIHEAYAYAMQLKDRLEASHTVHIYGDGKRNCSVYCHPLIESARKDREFKKHNPRLTSSPNTSHDFYVGQTSLTVEQRLENHMNPQHKNKTKWGQSFFVGRHQASAFVEGRAVGRALVRKFERATGLCASGLAYSESMVLEALFARWIQSQGHHAYYA